MNAQYFGRNKVQYEKFDFKVLATEHFDIYHYPEEEAAVAIAARMAERWYSRISKLLQHELRGRQPLILYAAHPHFQQTNTLSGEIGEGTGGVTESAKRRVILPFAGGLAETDHVLGHELVHAFQYDMAAQTDLQGRPIGPGLQALPLWFIEGMAEYLSIGPIDANTAMWVREAASRNAMPTIDKLDDPDFFPYRYGHAFWAYVAGRWGDRAVGDMLRATGPEGDIETAMAAVLGTDKDTLSKEWHDATRRSFAAVYETTKPPSAFGRPLITRETGGGDINLSPAISPDGKRIVFLSERSLFSIDMFVADVATGKIGRRLVETTSDPHFDSLQFLSSAGDWAPDNRRFVFAALSAGQPVLTIVDADRGRREAEHEFADLGEIYNPAWSPDGRRIAFSALKGGVARFVSVRSREQAAATTHQRCVRRSRSRVDAGRPRAGVGDGPVLVRSGIVIVRRQLPHCGHVHRRPQASRVRRLRDRTQHQSGVRGGRHALFRRHAGRHPQRLSPGQYRVGGAHHEHRVGSERHHAADAGDVGRVGGAGDRLHGV